MTLRTVSDLLVIVLSGISLATIRPTFRRWKSDVMQRVRVAELESFLRSRVVITLGWAWCAIIISMLLIAVWDLLG